MAAAAKHGITGRVTWLWIPLTIAAAFLQNLRTAVQKHLRGQLSTKAATFTRFAFASPLIVLYALGLKGWAGFDWPAPSPAFVFSGRAGPRYGSLRASTSSRRRASSARLGGSSSKEPSPKRT